MAATLVRDTDTGALFRGSCTKLFQFIEKKTEANEIVIAVPGGRSIVGFLNTWHERRSELDRALWKRLHFFLLDERLVELTAPESNYRLVNEVFFSKLLAAGHISNSQLHPFKWQPTSTDNGVSEYEQELKTFQGKFHAVLLGVGEDAHVGALFPGHHSIRNDHQGFITLADSPKPPPARMTASRTLIRSAKFGLAFILESGKRDALRNYLNPQKTVEQCPAKLINEIEEGYVVTNLLDESEMS